MMEMDLMQKRVEFIQTMKDGLVDMDKEGNEIKFWSSEFLVKKYLHLSDADLALNKKMKEEEIKEEVLAKEIITLGANNVEIGRRMVSFTGDKEMLYKANFCLRTAVKVLKPIKEFKATDADEVYEVVKQMDWSEYMDTNNTFLVDSVVFSEKFRHSKFVAYRVKDAIADFFREKTGERPNVGITNPDIRINIHIAEDDVTISLDSSGESLHRRGYRQDSVAAPLNEVLAAGMIMLTGWDGECDLIDPMCGSGTILIEAAMMALKMAPGLRRFFAAEKFGFIVSYDGLEINI